MSNARRIMSGAPIHARYATEFVLMKRLGRATFAGSQVMSAHAPHESDFGIAVRCDARRLRQALYAFQEGLSWRRNQGPQQDIDGSSGLGSDAYSLSCDLRREHQCRR